MIATKLFFFDEDEGLNILFAIAAGLILNDTASAEIKANANNYAMFLFSGMSTLELNGTGTCKVTLEGYDNSGSTTMAISAEPTINTSYGMDGDWESNNVYYYPTTPQVKTPKISIPSGEYEEIKTVSISCDTPTAKIYYTTDGSDPTKNSIPYTNPFKIDENLSLKAKAFRTDYLDSEIASEEYTFIYTKIKIGGEDVKLFNGPVEGYPGLSWDKKAGTLTMDGYNGKGIEAKISNLNVKVLSNCTINSGNSFALSLGQRAHFEGQGLGTKLTIISNGESAIQLYQDILDIKNLTLDITHKHSGSSSTGKIWAFAPTGNFNSTVQVEENAHLNINTSSTNTTTPLKISGLMNLNLVGNGSAKITLTINNNTTEARCVVDLKYPSNSASTTGSCELKIEGPPQKKGCQVLSMEPNSQSIPVGYKTDGDWESYYIKYYKD